MKETPKTPHQADKRVAAATRCCGYEYEASSRYLCYVASVLWMHDTTVEMKDEKVQLRLSSNVRWHVVCMLCLHAGGPSQETLSSRRYCIDKGLQSGQGCLGY
jgi:hypothetical protein